MSNQIKVVIYRTHLKWKQLETILMFYILNVHCKW